MPLYGLRILFLLAIFLTGAKIAVASPQVSEQPDLNKAYRLQGIQMRKDARQGMRLTLRRSEPSSLDFSAPANWQRKKFRLWLVPWHATGANAYKLLTFYQNQSVSESPLTPFVRANLSYDFLLPKQAFDTVRLVFYPASGAPSPAVVIDKLEVVDTVWEDSWPVPYLVALGLLLALLVPGLGLVAVLGRKYQSWQSRVLLLFPLTMLFWLLSFVVFMLMWRVLPEVVAWVYPGLVLASFLVLLVPAWRAIGSFPELRKVVLFFMLSGMLLTHIMIKNTPLPEQNFSYNSVSGPKTFWAFWAVDNYLPYANARALALHESFQKYYGPPGHPALFYQPEDREMASGAIYAAIRTALAPISNTLSDSYATFATFALFSNLLVIFPLWLLVKRYLPDRNPIWVLLATAATAFFIGNLFMAWFKMAGAALFLSALGWWLIHHDKSRWWVTGLIFGLATNMHASLAMGLPVLFIWFVVSEFRSSRPTLSLLEKSRLLWGPLQLGLVFTLVNVPWAVLKALFFRHSTVLLQEMFLNGEHDPRGLWATIELFFAHYSLSVQLHYRLQQMLDSLQWTNWTGIFMHLASNFYQGLKFWNLFEFDRVSMLFAPLLLLVLLQAIWSRFASSLAERTADYLLEQRQLLWVCAISTLLLLFLAYGAPPDVNYHNPMAILVLAYLLLVIRLLGRSEWLRVLYFLYLGLTVFRLSLQL